jgi:DNA-binding NtrC family response regulator
MTQTILIADDDAFLREFIAQTLEPIGHSCLEAEDGKDAIDKLEPDLGLVLLDLQMPHASGLEVLAVARRRCPDVPVMVISGTGEVEDAVSALKHGATDYIAKPFVAEELLARVREILKRRALESENEDLRSAFSPGRQIDLIANSSRGSQMLDRAKKAAQVDSTVLITGSSGTGKSALAQWIHQQGPRSDAPFVCVSCGAVPRELIESELFGHEKGAFTGADRPRIGRFESASTGTLFLDEVGELPIDMQPKLLNVLQDRSFTRVGSSDARGFHGRVIAATNKDLSIAVEEGEFREDLFYRLNVLHLEVPSLKNRQDDIPAIVIQKLRDITSRLGLGSMNLSNEAMNAMIKHEWPGNVRELENVLERAVVYAEVSTIDLDTLGLRSRPTAKSSKLSLVGYTLAEIERLAIVQMLLHVNGRRADAARMLGVSERTIYNRLREYEQDESTS